jgi:hypothetical protein
MAEEHEYLISSELKNCVEYKPLIYDLAEVLMYFCIFYPAFILFGRFFEAGILLYFRGFIILVTMTLMTFNRRKARKVYIFAVILSAIVILPLLVPAAFPIKIITFCYVFIAAIVSIQKLSDSIKRKNRRIDPTIKVSNIIFSDARMLITCICTLYLTYMVSLALRAGGFLYVCLAALSVFLSCFGSYIHKTGTYSIIEFKNDRGVSIAKIKRFNLFFCCCCAAAVVVIGFITYQIVSLTGLGSIDDKIINFFLQTPKKAVNKLPQMDPLTPVKANHSMYILNKMGGSPSVVSKILYIVVSVFMWLLIAAVSLTILLALIRFVLNLIKKLKTEINEQTSTVFSINEVLDDILIKIKKSKVATLFPGTSYNIKVRRLYFKLVKKYNSKGIQINSADTPTEIGEKIKAQSGTNIDKVTTIYEKARYGLENCDKGDVELLKDNMGIRFTQY